MSARSFMCNGCLILAMIGASEVSGQWIPVAAPEASFNVQAFVEYGGKKFISTTNGFYSSSDVAGNWIYEGDWKFSQYVLMGDSLVYLCKDDPYHNGNVEVLTVGNEVEKLELMVDWPFNSVICDQGRIFTTNSSGGFHLINPASKSFTVLNTGLPEEKKYIDVGYWVPIHPVESIAKIGNWFLAATWRGIYKSDVNDINWQAVVPDSLGFRTKYLYASGTDLFAVNAVDKKVYCSRDLGATWTDLLFSISTNVQTIFKADSTIYIGTDTRGIYAKTGGDSPWVPKNQGLNGLFINFIGKTGDNLVCGTSGGGFQYLNAAGRWTANNGGQYYSTGYNRLNTIGNVLFSSNSTTLFSSTNQGVDWLNVSQTFGDCNLVKLVTNQTTLFVLLYQKSLPGAYKLLFSTNYGKTWSSISQFPVEQHNDSGIQFELAGNRMFIYGGYKNDFFYSDNLASTWIRVTIPDQYCNGLVSTIKYNSTYFVAFCHYGQVGRIINNQVVTTNTGLPLNEIPMSLVQFCERLYCVTDQNQWYIFDDQNNSWSLASNIFENYRYRDLMQIGSLGFSANEKSEWSISDDCFQTIRPMNTSGLLSTGGINSLVFSDNTLFVTQGSNGIWKRSLSQITSVPNQEIRSDYVLIYPNPAADHFNITGLPNNESVTVSLIDLTGRILLQTKAFQDQKISIRDLIPGLYFVQIVMGKELVLKRIIIQSK